MVEIGVKMGAEGARPWRYFLDPWNVFDFIIVAVCFLPFNREYAAVLPLLRLLRVLKLVRALPRLQVLVGAPILRPFYTLSASRHRFCDCSSRLHHQDTDSATVLHALHACNIKTQILRLLCKIATWRR